MDISTISYIAPIILILQIGGTAAAIYLLLMWQRKLREEAQKAPAPVVPRGEAPITTMNHSYWTEPNMNGDVFIAEFFPHGDKKRGIPVDSYVRAGIDSLLPEGGQMVSGAPVIPGCQFRSLYKQTTFPVMGKVKTDFDKRGQIDVMTATLTPEEEEECETERILLHMPRAFDPEECKKNAGNIRENSRQMWNNNPGEE